MELDFFKFVLNHPILVAVFCISLYFVVFYTIKMKLSKVQILDPSSLALLVNRENALVLDVRARADYDAGHITGAISVIESDIEKNNLGDVAKDLTRPIIIVDKDGLKNYELGEHLVKAGHQRVYALKGGVIMWQQSSMPLVKK